jgi:hypothetical protein
MRVSGHFFWYQKNIKKAITKEDWTHVVVDGTVAAVSVAVAVLAAKNVPEVYCPGP